MTFMDDYRAGRTDGGDITDHIHDWVRESDVKHLWEYLGMTFEEYIRWTRTGSLPERGAP